MELRKFVAPEFVFGSGALELAGQYAANAGASRVLVVSDPGVKAAGWTGRVTASLDRAGLEHGEYLGVTPNPRDTEVDAGLAAWQALDCDVIVAVGGGSVMDCAKGIGILAANPGPIHRYKGADRIEFPPPPLICIPTTSGSSADVSQFAIITDTSEHSKMAIVSKVIVPDLALIDPSTLVTMGPDLTFATGMDAMVHALEALVSNAASPFTEMHALEALRLIPAHLVEAIRDPGNMFHRSEMMRASLEAGLAFSNASLGAIHAMAHALGGLLDLPHGDCNTRLLYHVVAMNHPHASSKYRQGFMAMGMPPGEPDGLVWFGNFLGAFSRDAGFAVTMPGERPDRATLGRLAALALGDPCMVTNPFRPEPGELEDVYARIFG